MTALRLVGGPFSGRVHVIEGRPPELVTMLVVSWKRSKHSQPTATHWATYRVQNARCRRDGLPRALFVGLLLATADEATLALQRAAARLGGA